MATVVTQNNLNEIIQSAIAIADSSSDLVSGILKSIEKVKKFDKKDLKQTKSIVSNTISYLTDVISSILDSKLFTDSRVVEMLASDNSKVINDALDGVSKIISVVPNTLNTISKIDLGFVATIKLRSKIRKLPVLFATLIGDMQKSLVSITSTSEFKTLREYVAESEELVESTLRDGSTTTKISKKLKHKGFVSVLLDYIKLFTDMCGLGESKFQVGALVKTRVNMAFLTSLLKTSLKNMVSALSGIELGDTRDKIETVNNCIESYAKLVESISGVSSKIPGLIVVNNLLSKIKINDLILSIVQAVNIDGKLVKSADNKIELINSILDVFVNIVKSISSIAKHLLAISLLKVVYNSIGLISLIINKVVGLVTDIDGRRISKADKKLDAVKGIILSLATVMVSLILLTPIITGFVLISPAILVALWAFKIVMWIILKTISSIVTAKTTFAILGLIGLIGLMLIVGTFIYLLVAMSIEIVKGILPLIAFFGIVALVTLGIIGIGWLIIAAMPILGPAAIGMLAMVVVVGTLFLMGVMLTALQTLNLDRDRILYNVHTVMDTAHDIIKAVFENTLELGGGKKSDPWYKQVLSFMGGAVLSLASAILAIPSLALSVVSVGLILFMATELRLLQNLNLDSNKIVSNVGMVLGTAKSISKLLFQPDDTNKEKVDQPWYQKVFDWAGGTVKTLIDGIMTMQFLATSLISVIFINWIAKKLVKIGKLQLDSNAIATNVGNIIGCAKGVISAIWSKDDTEKSSESSNGALKKLFEWAFPNLSYMVDAIMSVGFLSVSIVSVGMVKMLAENLIAINDTPDLTGIDVKVKSIIASAKTVIKSVFDGNELKGVVKDAVSFVKILPTLNKINDTVDGVGRLSHTLYDTIKDFAIDPVSATNQTKVLNKHIEFINKINSMDVEKLKTSSKMFEKMAEFSDSINGNFEGLAQTLNDKIAPLMEDLKELLTGVQDKVEESGANMSKAAFNSGKTLSEPEMTAQVASENPRADSDQKARMVQQRMEEQARNQTNAITSKLDELIELFKNGYAQVRTT